MKSKKRIFGLIGLLMFISFSMEAFGQVITENFEDGVIDTNMWVVGGSNGGNDGPGSGDGQWYNNEITATDGYLQARATTPESGNTFGAQAWTRTVYNFNDGNDWIVNFTWEPDIQTLGEQNADFHLIEITDGRTDWSDGLYVHPLDKILPGTQQLYLSNGVDFSPTDWSIVIDASDATATLYEGTNGTGTMHPVKTLDEGLPWYVRFIVTTGTSAGYPAKDCRINLYSFTAMPGENDADGDGIPDDQDNCPLSDLEATIIIDGCNSGVANTLFDDGCTMSDLIAECAEGVKNHGQFVSCVAHLTNGWKKDKLISGKEKGAIQSCAARSDIPHQRNGTYHFRAVEAEDDYVYQTIAYSGKSFRLTVDFNLAEGTYSGGVELGLYCEDMYNDGSHYTFTAGYADEGRLFSVQFNGKTDTVVYNYSLNNWYRATMFYNAFSHRATVKVKDLCTDTVVATLAVTEVPPQSCISRWGISAYGANDEIGYGIGEIDNLSLIIGYVPVIDTDFSQDPGFTTTDPTDFYWNPEASATEDCGAVNSD